MITSIQNQDVHLFGHLADAVTFSDVNMVVFDLQKASII